MTPKPYAEAPTLDELLEAPPREPTIDDLLEPNAAQAYRDAIWAEAEALYERMTPEERAAALEQAKRTEVMVCTHCGRFECTGTYLIPKAE